MFTQLGEAYLIISPVLNSKSKITVPIYIYILIVHCIVSENM